jgi:hypothetical protein
MNKLLIISFSLFCVTLRGQLVITVSQPKVTGRKAVVELVFKNELTNEVQSARAICLLFDEHGKMVGQSTKWVLGQNKAKLAAKAEANFNFVITAPQPLISSNLTAKVIFSRLILEGSKPVDPRHEVEIIPAAGDDRPNRQ